MSHILHRYSIELKRILILSLITAAGIQFILCRHIIIPWLTSSNGASVVLAFLVAIVLGLVIKVYYRTIIVRYKSGRL